MSKEYICKALTRLSKVPDPDGVKLCDQVANRLTQMTSAQVKDIESALDFGWLKYKMKDVRLPMGANPVQIAEKRRAAQLLKRALPPVGAALGGNPEEGWDDAELGGFIRRYAAQAVSVTGVGYYLKGSFWAFSSHDDRAWTRHAWDEALRMLDAGIQVATEAAQVAKAQNVLRRWFATGDRALVLQKLSAIRAGTRGRRVGICYNGSGAVQNPGQYKEEGPGVIESVVGQMNGEWGYASPEAGTHNNIGFGVSFFSPGETAIHRVELHSTQAGPQMEVTRGGAIVHELSHRYALTRDEQIPAQTYAHVGIPVPAGGGRKGYGPFTCHAIAHSAPDVARTNADSYRLFCEEALLML